MRATSTLMALALSAVLLPAQADPVTIDFEKLTYPKDEFGDTVSQVALGSQYAKAYGISFSGAAWAVNSGLNGCSGQYTVLSPSGCGSLTLASDPSVGPTGGASKLTISVLGGFIDQFVFDYAAVLDANALISIWGTDENDQKPLASLLLTNSTQPGGCSGVGQDVRVCKWSELNTLAFSGVAHSITISGVDQNFFLDNLKFTAPTATPNPLPEPAGLALAAGALGALAWVRRRQAR